MTETSPDINRAYYAIIPANVRYDKEIPPNAKLLYGEITALCNQKGYCWASNDYFSKLYGCTKQSVSSWIGKLKDNGYISVEIIYKEGSKEILNRYIKIVEYPIQNNLNTPIQNNLKDNNTSFNNTSNNTYKNIINYQMIVDMYNEICISFPRVISLSDARKKAIKARLKKYTVEQFEEVFTLAEASDFLKGANNRDWQANFDWLIKDANFAKVLDGNYENPAKPLTTEQAKDIIQKGRATAQKYATGSRSRLERNVTDSWDNKPEPKTAANDADIKARAEALKQQLQGG